MARRLKAIAAEINTIPGLSAEIVEGYCDTDRKPRGVCWRIPGAGRTGNKLVVASAKTGETIFSHNAAETYRHNGEVETWLSDIKSGRRCKRCGKYSKRLKLDSWMSCGCPSVSTPEPRLQSKIPSLRMNGVP